ncbi:hydroxymyristoyl-ACP dehydratase [Pontibacillus halophilus JSM 076056 = DSM 19796]|uniref:Hydroxymyristoyl-ACP dehydratase n=1 Tax=Pontibacillus halophilus JSM 076056 = DSM 19796 TaxID=1385510 RepID=A0A0A5GPJ2_9BACI|nr:DNA-directed RNA polymerase subunit beta [Pontibacillus halophilus]KGX93904.1 hydroxymyristoyl-ACP dehydratase [Pontibacillus halophilus JSM 076056 = DSM 19796]
MQEEKKQTKPVRHEKPEKKEQKESSKQGKKKETKTKYRRRLLPIWLRIVIVLVTSILALLAGMMIGYGVLGDGNPLDALKVDTWKHIFDLVMKTE